MGTDRIGWGKYVLLALLVTGGAAGGLYLSGGWGGRSPERTPDNPPGPHSFALTALDAKDTVEAPALAVGANGAVFVTWASKTADTERTVFFTRSLDGGHSFDAAKAVSKASIYRTAKGGKKGYERRATPHLAATGESVYLAWGEALADGSAMRLVLATSTDAGATFGPPRPVHSAKKANPTFTSLASNPSGALACAWLDDRGGVQQPFAAVGKGGEFAHEQLVPHGQEGVCPCCPTAACFGPDGTLYVAFRDVKDGYRDIAIGRLAPGRQAFEGPFAVVENTWKFDGCPHDGPSLAVVGDMLHVAWMDARTPTQRCYHARARLADMKFEASELHAQATGSQGNAKLFADATGKLYAVWEESIGAEPSAGHQHGPPKVGAGGGRAVMVAVKRPGQAKFGPARAVAPKPGAFQTRPAIAGANGKLFVAWNELDTTGKAVVVTPLAGTEAER